MSIVAIIRAPERSTQARLAAEALRQAAQRQGKRIDIEIDGQPALGADILQAASQILLVDCPDDARAGQKPARRATLDAVLADPAAQLDGAAAAERALSIVAITGCPTGIAHTFMAAEGLVQGAKALGHAMRVETQGSVGAQNALTDAEIAAADLVVIAADTQVQLDRFAGKRLFKSGTKAAIGDGKALIRRAIAEAQPWSGAAAPAAQAAGKEKTKDGPYRHLMTGVSFMLPFVTAGGILIALAFALGGIYAFDDAHKGTLAWSLFQIGAKSAFALMVPILAGYIAYSVADRPGIAPGMVGGMLAASLGSGFLGGIVAGFIAGYGTRELNRRIQLGQHLDGLKPVLILPVLGSLLTGLLMIYVVGQPVAAVLAALTDALKGMQGSSALALGALLGAMMAFDMGGPVNKAAYAFATGLIASQVYTPMAAVMAAGMTPPLGIALATRLFRDRFTVDEHEAGKAAAVLGLAFISEGAIPFAARDPFRVIPALMAGSALAGAVSMTMGVELKVPHGGVFVLPIPNAVEHLASYLAALAAGTVVTALALGLLKKRIPQA
ncbi:Phosphotransferase system fructose-specific component IIB [Chromobacterium violaceum]|uniref:PTS fructose transporter subunit IIC n=1 Tax=Chromobacterium violaceum TaxID=536 RepID=UPI00096FD858|nr:fructose-specific PTS transporter subunit EIIC [Chromobacterium violaceum]MBX9266687.1 fructose-specific PTS transporter subunit EIIC [Chromobacterium violaceum]OLZ82562.1 PTS fructose transporter subunit EIIBC [Chromobacterium violaceum]QIY80819.1 PTS fructose transporter subunit EIIBC [Chromobacterium violaceum]STB64402.1 EIIBC-Fru [Chromobacterium violaceum]